MVTGLSRWVWHIDRAARRERRVGRGLGIDSQLVNARVNQHSTSFCERTLGEGRRLPLMHSC